MGGGSTDGSSATGGEPESLGVSLGPVLRERCEGRLGEISWFRSTWQRGGAATGYAKWTRRAGSTIDVVVKAPVNHTEWRWTSGLGAVADDEWDRPHALGLPTPRVLASGDTLGGYDLAWLVMEQLPGQPVASKLSKSGIREMLRAAARFHSASARLQPASEAHPPKAEDWGAEIEHALEACLEDRIPESQRWATAIKRVRKELNTLTARWRARPIDTWCHGDLHGHNAMVRPVPGDATGSCVLIDLALVHPGCWIEDALYLERLYWARPELMQGIKVVQTLAKFRKDMGLHDSEGARELAPVRRLLMASTAPAFLSTEGHPAHLHAALELVERLGPQLTR